MFLLILSSKLVIAGLLLGSSLFVKGRSFLFKYRKWLLPTSLLLIFIILIYSSFLHYQTWNSDEFTKLLNSDESFTEELDRLGVKFISKHLDPIFIVINSIIKTLIPTYTGGTYLLFYLLTRLWGEYIISFIFAEIFLFTMLSLNKKYDSRFFYDEEPYFGAVAIFLSGWPGWLYYLIILLSLFLIFNFFATAITRKKNKIYENNTKENINNDAPNLVLEDNKQEDDTRFTIYYFWLPIAIIVILLMWFMEQNLPYYYLLKI